jgi:acetyl esterase/lipase
MELEDENHEMESSVKNTEKQLKPEINEMKDNIMTKDSEPELEIPEALKFMRIVMFSPIKIKFENSKKQYPEVMKAKRVIIHYHGGGFICMSSKSHQLYLRFDQ